MKQARILLAAVITAAFAAPVAHAQSQTDAAQAEQAAKQAQESAEAADAAATAAEAQAEAAEDQAQAAEGQATTTMDASDDADASAGQPVRSEERRDGKACVSTCRYRGYPDP